MNIVFFASADFAIPTLNAIYNSHHKICAVYTREPKEAGRGLELQNTPIHNRALELGLEIHHPKKIKEKSEKILRELNADIFVVVAYGLLLPKEILNIAKYGCINIHPSLLPRWRGAAPLQRALMNGDKESGVCVIVLGEGLDDGDILASERTIITKETTLENLHDELSVKGAELMVQVLDRIEREQKVIGTPQSQEGLIYAEKIDKDESKLDFNKTTEQNFNIIRTIGGYFEHNGERIKILKSDYEMTKNENIIKNTLNLSPQEQYKLLLEQKPVANLVGNEFPDIKTENKIIERVGNFFKEIGNNVIRDDIGKILLTKNSIRNTLYYGFYSNKIISFKAIPNIIKYGIIFEKQINWKERNYNTYLLGANIAIAKQEYIAEAIIKETDNGKCKTFYLHNVTKREFLLPKQAPTIAFVETPSKTMIKQYFKKSIEKQQERFIVENNKLYIKCNDGVLIPLILQREGKKALAVEEFLRGFKIS